MKAFFQKKNKRKGFTIIEMIIAIGIFLTVITIGIGALLNANLVHRKSQDMRSVMDNLSFIMEDMSRNIRTGYNYQCTTGNLSLFISQNCEDGLGLSFFSSENNDRWIYYIGSDNGVVKIFRSIGNPSIFIPLTDGNEIVIDPNKSGFSVIGPPLGSNNQQPFVIIRLNGTIAYRGNVTPFSIETSVSQRLINI